VQFRGVCEGHYFRLHGSREAIHAGRGDKPAKSMIFRLSPLVTGSELAQIMEVELRGASGTHLSRGRWHPYGGRHWPGPWPRTI